MSSITLNERPSQSLVAGKFELVRIIGRGGMGAVWEGRHTSLGTRVAIKFIEKEYADSQEARQRFDNEAKAAARIQSKHAIQIFDYGITDDGKPYIVMEFLDGEPLDKRIERLGRLPLQDVGRILQQVTRGLQRAHDAGIIHRDLKPENIFLVRNPDDDEEVAKVLDFGIAKMRGPNGVSMGLSSSTKTGAVLGTPYYMSPEQARGLRDVDHRTDLWSLGVIVFKAVTGVLPFDGESLGDLLVKICTAPVPVPSQVLPGLPEPFDTWFQRALDRDPQRRFSSATELSDQLSYVCGISVRRGPSSSVDNAMARAKTVPSVPPPPGGTLRESGPHGSSPSSPSSPPYARAANVTSAPFTASSPQLPKVRTASPFAIAIVGVVTLLIGGIATLFVVSRGKIGNDAVVQPATTVLAAEPTSHAATPPAVDTAAALATNAAPAVPVPPPLTTDAPEHHAPSTADHVGGSGASTGTKKTHGGKPAPSTPAVGTKPSAAPPPVTVAPPPATTPSKPPPTTVDPGY